MITTIVREGDSLGIIFDEFVMKSAQLQLGDEVNVEFQPDGTIRITPIRLASPEDIID
jgi:antitoxin component of MazEF toxin-antitoxin module